MKGIVEPLPPTSGALRWARSVDNAPIRRCVPKKRDTIYRRNPKLREILGRVLARVPADSAGGGLRVCFQKTLREQDRSRSHSLYYRVVIIACNVSDNVYIRARKKKFRSIASGIALVARILSRLHDRAASFFHAP